MCFSLPVSSVPRINLMVISLVNGLREVLLDIVWGLFNITYFSWMRPPNYTLRRRDGLFNTYTKDSGY